MEAGSTGRKERGTSFKVEQLPLSEWGKCLYHQQNVNLYRMFPRDSVLGATNYDQFPQSVVKKKTRKNINGG